MSKSKVAVLSVLLTLVGCGAVGLIVLLVVMYGGAYDVSASRPHTALMEGILEETRDSSVKSHAKGAQIPEWYATADQERGFAHYDEMCALCHGAPGVEPAELVEGLNPEAPGLVEAGEEWDSAELFWIVKHGIKMSGMPAFGGTHSDESIWHIAAFVQGLRDMAPAQYANLQERVGSGMMGEEGHEEGAMEQEAGQEEGHH